MGDDIFDLGIENEALRGKLLRLMKNGWVSLRTG